LQIHIAKIKRKLIEKPVHAALLFAVLAFLFSSSYFHQKEARLSFLSSPQVILAAKHTFSSGHILREEDLGEILLQGTFLTRDMVRNKNEVLGKVLQVDLEAGSPLLKPNFSEIGANTGLAPVINPEKRSMSFLFSPENASADLIKPGDRVDVFANLEVGERAGKYLTTMISQDLLVLSVGKHLFGEPFKKKKTSSVSAPLAEINTLSKETLVSLEVSVEELPKLIFAREYGNVSLSLRAKNAKNVQAFPRASVEDLLPGESFLQRKQRFHEYRGAR